MFAVHGHPERYLLKTVETPLLGAYQGGSDVSERYRQRSTRTATGLYGLLPVAGHTNHSRRSASKQE